MVIPFALLLLAAPAGQSPDQSLAPVLERAGQYVRRFETDFAIIISDERYEQKAVITDSRGIGHANGQRTIRSETLFAWLPEDQSWLTARNVLSVDGSPVVDSKRRLDDALAESGNDRRSRLRRLRDEGARFNLGRIYRNFNDPTLVLQFLDPAFQPRFDFTMLGAEKANGVDAWKVRFSERSRPTLIQRGTLQAATMDLVSSGTVWIARTDGSVVRTALTAKDESTNTTADIVVDYRLDPKLGLNVPVKMSEVYVQQSLANIAPSSGPPRVATRHERIECVATYSNYRRFETSGRLVTPN